MKNHLACKAALFGFLATLGTSASAAIDTTEILATINDGQVAGVAVSIAFGVALWVLKGTKLIRPR